MKRVPFRISITHEVSRQFKALPAAAQRPHARRRVLLAIAA